MTALRLEPEVDPALGHPGLAIVAVLAATGVAIGIWQSTAGSDVLIRTVGRGGEVVGYGPAAAGPFRPILSLGVFRLPGDLTDVLSAEAARDAALISSNLPDEIGEQRLGHSRLLIEQPNARTSVYAWPIGQYGYCVSVSGVYTHCDSGFPFGSLVASPAVAASGGRSYVAGVVSDEVTSVKVETRGFRCVAKVRRNGFLCVFAGVRLSPGGHGPGRPVIRARTG